MKYIVRKYIQKVGEIISKAPSKETARLPARKVIPKAVKAMLCGSTSSLSVQNFYTKDDKLEFSDSTFYRRVKEIPTPLCEEMAYDGDLGNSAIDFHFDGFKLWGHYFLACAADDRARKRLLKARCIDGTNEASAIESFWTDVLPFIPKNAISTFDGGFYNIDHLNNLNEQGRCYIIRVREDDMRGLNFVQEFQSLTQNPATRSSIEEWGYKTSNEEVQIYGIWLGNIDHLFEGKKIDHGVKVGYIKIKYPENREWKEVAWYYQTNKDLSLHTIYHSLYRHWQVEIAIRDLKTNVTTQYIKDVVTALNMLLIVFGVLNVLFKAKELLESGIIASISIADVRRKILEFVIEMKVYIRFYMRSRRAKNLT